MNMYHNLKRPSTRRSRKMRRHITSIDFVPVHYSFDT